MSSTRHHLAQVIAERSLLNSNLKDLAKEVAAYLLDSGDIASLDSLMRDVIDYRASHGVVEVMAVTANPLSDKDIQDIDNILKNEYKETKTFKIDQRQTPEVLGGVKLSLPGEQLDLTVRSKVNKFKRLTTAGKGA